jgi:hypothetical protein
VNNRFSPVSKTGNRKEKFLRQHAFECVVLCLKRGSPDRESTNNEGALMATIDSISKDSTRLSDGPDWTFELLDVYLAEIDRVAKLYRLDTYPHQIEVITSEQMMDAYSSVGMPINYPHWSFGKKFIETERLYKHGQQGWRMKSSLTPTRVSLI